MFPKLYTELLWTKGSTNKQTKNQRTVYMSNNLLIDYREFKAKILTAKSHCKLAFNFHFKYELCCLS